MGAQPEQLVEGVLSTEELDRIRERLHGGPTYPGFVEAREMAERLLRSHAALATALSECLRERDNNQDYRDRYRTALLAAIKRETNAKRALSECREALEIIAKGEHSQPASYIAADAELAAQPPSKASEEERCTTCGATPETGINSDCPECYGITQPSEASERSGT